MERKTKYLKQYLLIFGLLNIFVISFTVPLLLGDWLLWEPRNLAVEMMMSSIYLAMGIVMVLIARNPLPHKAFIDFLVVANLGHAFVMLIFSKNVWQVVFDVGAIALMGALPLFFYPWGLRLLLRY